MKNQILFVLMVAACLGGSAQQNAGFIHSSTSVRVLLQRSTRGVSFQTRSPCAIRINDRLRKPRLPAGWLHISAYQSRVRLVRIPYRPLLAQSVDLLWPTEKASLDWENRLYRGAVRITAQGSEAFLVNRLPLENYVASSLGSEMSAHWSLEALKAQAVAVRTYARYHQNRPRHRFYDLDSTTEDQVYSGVKGEGARTWQATRQTAGLYLTRDGRAVKAFYHSRCGGSTASAKAVWGGGSGSQSIPCPYCRENPFRWTARWNRPLFLQKLGLPASEKISVQTVRAGSFGRVFEIEVRSGAHAKRFSSEALRRLLGYTTLKSNQFILSSEEDEVQAQGVGLGHGVGMCQWGARHLANRGQPFDRILEHYYPKLVLGPLRNPAEKGLDPGLSASVWSPHAAPGGLRLSAARRADRKISDVSARSFPTALRPPQIN